MLSSQRSIPTRAALHLSCSLTYLGGIGDDKAYGSLSTMVGMMSTSSADVVEQLPL